MSQPHNNTILACAYSLSVHPDALALFLPYLRQYSQTMAEGKEPTEPWVIWTLGDNTCPASILSQNQSDNE